MAITTKDIQDSLKLENDIDTRLIQRYINTAETYVQEAVDRNVPIEKFRGIEQFDTAVALFVEYLYLSRGETSNNPSKPPREITALIQQLRGKFFTE